MIRTIASLFLAAVLGTTGALVATAEMKTPAQASISTTVLNAAPMTPGQIDAAKAVTAGKASAAPKKVAITTARIKQIRAWAGMAPCRYEDGSGQVLPCYWNAKMRGNGKGKSFIAVTPSKKGDDPRIIFIP